MTKFLLDKLLEEVKTLCDDEEASKRKAKNKRKSENQSRRPQGKGRKKK